MVSIATINSIPQPYRAAFRHWYIPYHLLNLNYVFPTVRSLISHWSSRLCTSAPQISQRITQWLITSHWRSAVKKYIGLLNWMWYCCLETIVISLWWFLTNARVSKTR